MQILRSMFHVKQYALKRAHCLNNNESDGTNVKYALISDVHGNLPALLAVLRDAGERGADRYLLLGDYVFDLPWANEIVDALQAIEGAVIIRGNKENYLDVLQTQDSTGWTDEQHAGVYWIYRQLTPENRAYLIALPASAEVETPSDRRIYLSHSSPVFYRQPEMRPFPSRNYLTDFLAAPFDHGEYLARARQAVLENAGAMADIGALPGGVHAFGHNHLQFHMAVGDKLFVNPGSCGLPCDGDPRAAYTLFVWTAGGWQVEERRVPYDIEGTVKALIGSSLFREAEVWSRIVAQELPVALDYIAHFIQHLNSLTHQNNRSITNSADNAFWREAAATFPLMDIFA